MCGVRTTFIRFGLCDYRCTMCDSLHAVLPELVKQNATWMTREEIEHQYFNQFPDGSHSWVTLSGGNPAIHELSRLIDTMHANGISVAVETQGTEFPDWIPMCDNITVSPKGPGMGEKFEENLFLEFVMRLKHHTGFNVKVVVFSQQDLEFAQYINQIMKDNGLWDKMYLSLGNWTPPGKDHNMTNDQIRIKLMNEYSQLSEDLLMMPSMHNVKFLPQLHVLAWANKQGV